MTATPVPIQDPAAGNRERLVALLEGVASIADAARPVARHLTLLAALSAVWLAYSVQQLAGASTQAALAIGLVLLIPAAVFAWLWWMLGEVRQLPAQVSQLYGSVQEMAARRARERAEAAAAIRPSGFRGLFQVGPQLREALGLALGADDLRDSIVNLLVFASPLFLLAVGASLLWTFGQVGLALLTAVLAAIF